MTTYQIWHDRTNEHIADLYYENGTYRAKLYKFSGGIPTLFGFPEAGTRPDPPSECIEHFLEDRVIPPNRDMLKHILEQNGIYEYDWRVLIKLNKGRTTDDLYRIEVIEDSEEQNL